ncbi:hypothetical protein [Micromonospora sp. LOL_015]|uniref:hypothetical protein n=1 Tax=Micromonospora sp. LOL_015 TaxID=3345416 RepID=UPI003A8619EE
MDPLTAGVIVLALVVTLLFAACAGLYRRLRDLELATYNGVGLRFGAEQAQQSLPGFNSNETTFALKINRQCPVCDELVMAVGKLAPKLPAGYSFALLSDDLRFDKPVPQEVNVIRDPKLWRSITVPYTPALLVVDQQGIIAFTTPIGSSEALNDFVERTTAKEMEMQK